MNYELEIALRVLQVYAPHTTLGDGSSRELTTVEAALVNNAAELVNDYLLKVGRFAPQTAQQNIDSHVLAAYTSMFGGPQTR